jgi:pimeloyl-ACP methyl ester carboxylesterase
MHRFTETTGLGQYALCMFDYGAPIGLRMALAHPEQITALMSQNGNTFEQGLSDIWDPFQAYGWDPSPANPAVLRELLSPAGMRSLY